MRRSVTLTTPIPTLEELRVRLGVSKARMRELLQIMEGDRRHASRSGSRNGHSAGMVERNKSGRTRGRPNRPNAGRNGKSERAASSR
jgi:DNA-binding FadR family transcriptional regulator